ncbi:MAG: FHA domain-containing protein [Planctomycetaceae bacterium]|jgi:hypothetical protein|nr:FHA domain-containing protein [Planctomycetaceae bacterium]
MTKQVKLAVYYNGEWRGIREMTLPLVIGRSQDANLSIPHPMVSRRHCLLFKDQDGVRLRDLGSLNGTFVNKERVAEVTLTNGSEFQIGNIRFFLNPPSETAQLMVCVEDSAVASKALIQPPPLPPKIRQTPPSIPSFVSDYEGNGVKELNNFINLANPPDTKTPPTRQHENQGEENNGNA